MWHWYGNKFSVGDSEVEGFHLKLQGRHKHGDKRFGHLGLCDRGHGWELQHPGFVSCDFDPWWLLFFGQRIILIEIDEDRHLQRIIPHLCKIRKRVHRKPLSRAKYQNAKQGHRDHDQIFRCSWPVILEQLPLWSKYDWQMFQGILGIWKRHRFAHPHQAWNGSSCRRTSRPDHAATALVRPFSRFL